MKLHLPKALLTAVLATFVFAPQSWAGWASDGLCNGYIYYYDNEELASSTIGIFTLPTETNGVTANVDMSLAVKPDKWQKIYMVSGYGGGNQPQGYAGQNTTIGKVVADNNVSLTIAQNPWQGWKYYDALTIETLEYGEGDGSGSFNVTHANDKVAVNAVSGCLSSVTNAGTLTIGETGGTTYLSGNLTNTGTQTFEGNVTFVGAGPGNDKSDGFVITNAGTTVFKNGPVAGDAEGGILLSVQNGANVIVGGGDTVTTMELKQLRLHDGSTKTTEVFTIKDNAIVNIIGKDAGNGTGDCAVVLGHWHDGTSKLNVEGGKLNVLNGTIKLGGDSNSEMNITGGTVNAEAITFDTTADDDILNLDGGRLNIGSGGISHEAYWNRRTLKLTSGTLGALAEIINITNVPTTIGGQFVIDTAIVNAEGEKTGAVASISFTNGVTMTTDAALTIKGGGSVSFGDSPLTVTNTITVLDGTELEFGDITLDVSEWTPDSGTKFYTEDGLTASESGNGFYQNTATYLLFDGYEWEGTVENEGTGVTLKDGNTYVAMNEGLSTIYYVRNAGHEIDGKNPDSYEATRVTAYHVAAGQTLTISADPSANMTAGQILIGAQGNGTINLATEAQISNAESSFAGDLVISQNGVLSIGGKLNEDENYESNNESNYKSNTGKISNFDSVTLKGGTIVHNAISSTINSLTVGQEGGTFHVYDQKFDQAITFAETTTLNGLLTIKTTWKQNLTIQKLQGSGDITVEAATYAGGGDSVKILISDFGQNDNSDSGHITVNNKAGSGGTTLQIGGGVDITNNKCNRMWITANDGVRLVVDGHNSSKESATASQYIGKIELGNNAVLNLNDGSYYINQGLLIKKKASATVENQWDKQQYIDNIQGEGSTLTLTRKNAGQAGWNAAFNVFTLLNEGEYSGVIKLVNQEDAAAYNHGLTVKAAAKDTLKNTVVEFGSGNDDYGSVLVFSNSNTGVNGSLHEGTVGGLTGTKGRVYATQLTINTAEGANYTTAAELKSDMTLVKSGAGKQSFSGNMSAFTGSIMAVAGELAFTATEALSVNSLSVANVGTLTVANGDAAGSIIAGGAVTLAGGAVINGNLNLNTATDVSFDVTPTPGTGITLNGALTMSSTKAFVDALDLTSLSAGDILTVFTGVSSFTVGDVTYDASNALTNVDLRDWGADAAVGQYTLTYDTSAEVGSIVITVGEVIPEPASATLSLAALMMLCARRRRSSR